MSVSGTVFHIQRFSLHDGPGIRTTVFLQGCLMECFWCHNPEGRPVVPALRYFSDRCIACGACVTACPHSAHELPGGVHTFHRARCEGTGACTEACFSGALEMTGRRMTANEVMEEVLADRPFYASSGGGVTLSGGEPALGGAFARALLSSSREAGIHTAIETCGECPWEALESLLEFTDLVMMDLKLMAPDRHRSATGRGNDRILANARRLARASLPLLFRTPVVPGVNDTSEEIMAIGAFVKELVAVRNSAAGQSGVAPPISYELLRFHRLASDKYGSLGLPYEASRLVPPGGEKMAALLEAARSTGIDAGIAR